MSVFKADLASLYAFLEDAFSSAVGKPSENMHRSSRIENGSRRPAQGVPDIKICLVVQASGYAFIEFTSQTQEHDTADIDLRL